MILRNDINNCKDNRPILDGFVPRPNALPSLRGGTTKQSRKRLNCDFNMIRMICMITCTTLLHSVGMSRSVETQTKPKDAFRTECNPYRKTFFYRAVMPDGIEIHNNEHNQGNHKNQDNHSSDIPDGFVPRPNALSYVQRINVIAMSEAKKQSRNTTNSLDCFTAFAMTYCENQGNHKNQDNHSSDKGTKPSRISEL